MAKLYDEVLAKTNIRDVINYYHIPIIKDSILCPFHDDHTPSMRINDAKNIVKCFSCGEGANPITFIYKYENKVNNNAITFNEAVKKAAEIVGLDIDFSFLDKQTETYQFTSNGRRYDDQQKFYLKINAYFKDIFVNEFVANQGSKAQSYLKERDISFDLAKTFDFGYAPKGIIHRIMSHNKKINPAILEQLGLLRDNANGGYDEVFQERIMIPIKDEKGNIVAFSGRTIQDDTPKYLHCKESPVFHKSNILYNYESAKGFAYQVNLIIVEGFMDVIGAKKMGFDNVVALMGTEITDEHINLFKKCNCKLTLALDNDDAGRNAIIKSIPKLLDQGFAVDTIDLNNLASKYEQKIKDFDDASKVATRMDIENIIKPGFHFLLDHQYFVAQKYDVTTIHETFKQLRTDNLLKDTLHLQLLNEYLMNKTDLTKQDLTDIYYPKELTDPEDPMEKLRKKALTSFISISFDQYVQDPVDSIQNDYLKMHKTTVCDYLIDAIQQDPEKHLDGSGNIQMDPLIDAYLENQKEYNQYTLLHRFPHYSALETTYQIIEGEKIGIHLDDAQKDIVINQYNKTITDNEKVNLGEADEMYIINKIEDLDHIIPELVNPLLKDTIADQMLTSNAMRYFKFSTLFDKSLINFIDKSFLTEKGDDFKTILLINNLDNKLKLSNENYMKHDEETKEESIELDVTEDKTIKHTEEKEELSFESKIIDDKNKILISKDRILKSSEKGILFKSSDPNITFFAPKHLCYWSDQNQTHLYIIPKSKALSKNTTVLSKYVNNTFDSKANIEDLKQYCKFIEPSKKDPFVHVDLSRSSMQEVGEFFHIPAIHQDQHGYFKVNRSYIHDDQNDHTELRGKENFSYSFYQDDQFIAKVDIANMQSCIDAQQKFDLAEKNRNEIEMEGL